MDLWETFHGRNTVRFCGLAARSRAFVDHALLNPVFTAVTDELLLANGADYWLNTGQVMAIGPGEPAQYLHRDENNWPEAVAADREVTVSCLFALSDFTRENGATVVVAGSQRRPPGLVRGAETSPDEIAYAEMPAGSGLIYSGKVIHGAGGNTTENWRYGMHVSFVVGWLRPEEASPLAVDRDRAASLPERARELLGWGSYHSEGGGRTWLVDFEDAARLFD
jgi:ectoine hydroxylase-related dioxygenase (phytanoyl-CoA dioxygenase family)